MPHRPQPVLLKDQNLILYTTCFHPQEHCEQPDPKQRQTQLQLERATTVYAKIQMSKIQFNQIKER